MTVLYRSQVRVLTGWDDVTLDRMVATGEIVDRGGFDPVEIYLVSSEAREALGQLADFASHGDEWWRHFPSRWLGLEAAGLVEVLKPCDGLTGYWRDREEWRVRLTPLGEDVVRELSRVV